MSLGKPAKIIVPLAPSHLYNTTTDQWVCITNFNDKQLKELAKTWGKDLIEMKKRIKITKK